MLLSKQSEQNYKRSLNIAIDGRPLLHQRSGVGRYTHQLILAFFDEKSRHNFYLCGLPGFERYASIPSKIEIESLHKLLEGSRKFQVPFPFRKITRLVATWISHQRKQPRMDIILWTNFLGEFSSKYKSIITIHDMAHHHYPQHTVPGQDKNLPMYLKDHARKADLILCVSENTKRDVINLLGVPEKKIWVTYNGVSEDFGLCREQNLLQDLRNRYGLPERFILFVGTIEPRKNLIKLIEALHLLYSHYQIQESLVCVGGKSWKNASLYESIQKLRLKARIIFTGYIPDADLPLFYNAATVFAYPSLYEGFGIPVIEAMACGVPVVTSNVSSLPEVAGDAALLINPEDPEEIASAIYKILTDQYLCNRLRDLGLQRAKRFTWKACAQKTLEAISYVGRCK